MCQLHQKHRNSYSQRISVIHSYLLIENLPINFCLTLQILHQRLKSFYSNNKALAIMDLKTTKGGYQGLRIPATTKPSQNRLKLAYNSPPKNRQATAKKILGDNDPSNNDKSEREDSININSTEQLWNKLRKSGNFKPDQTAKKIMKSNEKTHKKSEFMKQRVMSNECLILKDHPNTLHIYSEECKPTRSTQKRINPQRNTNMNPRTNSK